MKVLELFSGTGSVGKVCKQLDYEVVSVDMILPADHQVDIMEFDCKYWFIENPQTSLLKNQSFMKELPFVDGDYCMYGLPYRKRTRIWTNKIYDKEPLLLCNKQCGSFVDGRHIGSCGCGGQGQGHKKSYSDKSYTLLEKYRIPEQFIFSLFEN